VSQVKGVKAVSLVLSWLPWGVTLGTALVAPPLVLVLRSIEGMGIAGAVAFGFSILLTSLVWTRGEGTAPTESRSMQVIRIAFIGLLVSFGMRLIADLLTAFSDSEQVEVVLTAGVGVASLIVAVLHIAVSGVTPADPARSRTPGYMPLEVDARD
jgi:hypothetical protein